MTKERPSKSELKENVAQKAILDVFQRLVTVSLNVNASTSDPDLQIRQIQPYRNESEKAIYQAVLYNRFWSLLVKANSSDISIHLCKTGHSKDFDDDSARPALQLKTTSSGKANGIKFEDPESGMPLSDDELNGLIMACVNDLVKRTREIEPGMASDVRLTLGEQSLTSSFRKLISDNHALTADLLEQNEQFRNEIMMELHDDLIGDLMLLERQLLSHSCVASGSLRDSIKLVSEAIKKTRGYCQELTTRDLSDWGLEVTLRDLVARTAQNTNVKMSLEGQGLRKLEDGPSLHVYRILQECLKNAMEHSSCSAITMVLQTEPSRILFSVRDNGKGISEKGQKDKSRHNGLRIIQERLKIINMRYPAVLHINSAPGQGTEVILCVTDR